MRVDSRLLLITDIKWTNRFLEDSVRPQLFNMVKADIIN
jgi:hypothetical protein